jgi:nicotinamide-nucleotide amidase
MPVAELIAIGTELLLGEIQDTNSRHLARALRDVGVNLYRATLIGDNCTRISALIREALARADMVITTGGLGPTVDDPTRQAVADAFGVPLEFRPELWAQILARFQRYGRPATENNRRQAYSPAGSKAIENPVGTAPAFIVEQAGKAVICLPGVPREMEYLLYEQVIPYLRQSFHLTGVIKTLVLHTSGVGESQVDEWVGDLEKMDNPTVGLLAHPGQVDIRVTARADSDAEASQMLKSVAAEVRRRVGDAIYGLDQETLESVVLTWLAILGWSLAALDCGSGGRLASSLASAGFPGVAAQVNETPCHNLSTTLRDWMQRCQAQAGLAASLQPGIEKQVVTIVWITPYAENQVVRSYGGPPGNAPTWGARMALDSLRHALILQSEEPKKP